MELPKRVEICPWGDIYVESMTGGGSGVRNQNANHLSGGIRGSSPVPTAAGSYREWKFLLAAGTWVFTLIYYMGSSAGIIDISLDGSVFVNDLDMYSAGASYNNVSDTTGIVVAASGIYTLRIEVVNKNASSSGYGFSQNWLAFRRTA